MYCRSDFRHHNWFWRNLMAGNTNKALVLGATGGIGGEVARQLGDAGWQVRALQRGGPAAQEERDGMTWLRGDAMNRNDVMAAAAGCSVIVHAVNPPGYRRWDELVLPMLDNIVAAAVDQGATIVLPGTVYNYGPDAFAQLQEDSPQQPVTRVSLPGRTGIGHQWSYLPDVARAMVELLERRDTLEPFARFHLAGHWDADGTQMAQAIQRVVTRRMGVSPQLQAFPWWLITLASPFNATLRELREMKYLWNEAVRMGNRRLTEVLGHEPHTPLEQAVEATLEGMGCLGSR